MGVRFRTVSCSVITACVIFAAGGCAVDLPLNGEIPEDDIGTAFKARFGIEMPFLRANVDNDKASTAVHPDDAGFLTGQTRAEPREFRLYCSDHDYDPHNPDNLDDDDHSDGSQAAPFAGVFFLAGGKPIRFVGGLSGRMNMLNFEDGYREGMYKRKQQVSDMRHRSNGSFVFTQVTPGFTTLIPSVGLEGNIHDVLWGVEMGFPYQEWRYRSGHDRFGRWQTTQEGSWTGFGTRYAGTLGFGDPNDRQLFLSVIYETYDTSFGRVEGVGAIIGFTCSW